MFQMFLLKFFEINRHYNKNNLAQVARNRSFGLGKSETFDYCGPFSHHGEARDKRRSPFNLIVVEQRYLKYLIFPFLCEKLYGFHSISIDLIKDSFETVHGESKFASNGHHYMHNFTWQVLSSIPQ